MATEVHQLFADVARATRYRIGSQCKMSRIVAEMLSYFHLHTSCRFHLAVISVPFSPQLEKSGTSTGVSINSTAGRPSGWALPRILVYHNLSPKLKSIDEVKQALQVLWDNWHKIHKVVKIFTKRLNACVKAGIEHFEFVSVMLFCYGTPFVLQTANVRNNYLVSEKNLIMFS